MNLDLLQGAAECRQTAAKLRADHVLSSSSQALVWDKQARDLIEPLALPAAREIVADLYGGARHGFPPDCPTVLAQETQATDVWKVSLRRAQLVLLTTADLLFPEVA